MTETIRKRVCVRHTSGTRRMKEAKLAVPRRGSSMFRGLGFGHQHLDLGLCREIGIGELFSLWFRVSNRKQEAMVLETDREESTR